MTSKKILVVDDDKNITDLTQLILESAGYDCKIVNSGTDCIKVLVESKNAKFDLVLLDVAMPGFSGLDVIARVKEQQLFPVNRIVLFTASSTSMLDDNEIKKMGVLDCFKKPFRKPDLLKAVEKYVGT